MYTMCSVHATNARKFSSAIVSNRTFGTDDRCVRPWKYNAVCVILPLNTWNISNITRTLIDNMLMLQEGAEETVNIIRSSGGVARAYRSDVAKIDDVRAAALQVRAQMGDVEIVVNNAGYCACRNLLELSENDIRRTLDVNVLAHFWVSHSLVCCISTRPFLGRSLAGLLSLN